MSDCIVETLLCRWIECNAKVRQAMEEGELDSARIAHIRRDEVVMLSLRFGVSNELQWAIVNSGQTQVVVRSVA